MRSPRHQGSSPSPSAGSAADRYTIGRRISQGAFAQVYVGHDSRTNGTVCIKAITNTPEFSLEHEITARVTGHPNIVEYLGRFVNSRTLFSRMHIVVPFWWCCDVLILPPLTAHPAPNRRLPVFCLCFRALSLFL